MKTLMKVRKVAGSFLQSFVNRHTRFDWNEEMITSSIPYFQFSPRFQNAYEAGRKVWLDVENPPKLHWRLQTVLWASQTVSNRLIEQKKSGVFVECGTGRGFNALAILNFLDWNSTEHRMYLFDSFLPYKLNSEGLQFNSSPINPMYAKSLDSVKFHMIEFKRINFIPGRIPESLDSFRELGVDFLHIDLNHHSAEILTIDYFWPLLNSGAIVVLDDYAWHDCGDQGRAFDEWAIKNNKSIMSLGTGQGLIVK